MVGIEKKIKGVSRLYAKVIPNASSKEPRSFIRAHISPKANITTDQWIGYTPLNKEFEHMVHLPSGKKGSNFPQLHRVVINLKSWLRGVHHQVEHLQDYLNEYCYRFNRSFMKGQIFDNLIFRMVKAEPCYIKNLNN